ncbi:hypothetical protein IFM89_026005 [Coptis chinensis]|uniref:Late embryogenesis abundant protein LEA-2 subgroup domain-containing protein n=1 Tax=Coptis chinensis TaxID=261450 RepID=A0A835HF60_9MAGN|nr:hypothetical protein IFM89_018871 [Coptis chinensis]KAF9598229.1 hypothetical protein IFM89_026005 [Coptis chinensis]
MSQAHEIPLNVAYNGPSVPFQQPPRKRRRCGCCCVLGTTFTVILSIIVALGIAALIFWFVVRPTKMEYTVVSTDLQRFDLVNNNTIHYNLTLYMDVRNPNKRIGIYYDQLDFIASYTAWNRFAWAGVPRYYQGHRNTTNLRVNFQGQQLLVLPPWTRDSFNLEKSRGYFGIAIRVYSQIRFKVAGSITGSFKPYADCVLSIPLASNGTLRFESTRCGVDI